MHNNIKINALLHCTFSEFEYGSYVFQAYGSCPFANKTGDDGLLAAAATSTATATGSSETAEQAVSAQFVQTAADVLRIVDAYDGECGGGRNGTDECAAAAGNWSAAAEAVGYGTEAVGRVLDKLLLLDGSGGEYNVTLVHVTEYAGGTVVGAYVQDSSGARRLRVDGAGRHVNRTCEASDACGTWCRWRSPAQQRDPATLAAYGPLSIAWKDDVWTACTLTVSAVGAICAACTAAFIVVRVCKKDVMEGNPTFSLVLIAGTLLMYGSAVPFAVERTGHPHAVCYAKLFGTCASCSVVFSAMLARGMTVAACDSDTSFMSHVNGYLQTSLCAFTMCVQLALLLQFAAIHAIVPSSDLCRVFVGGNLFLGSLAYDALLLVLLCATAPFVYRSKRNYREGACFAVAAYLALAVWLCWCTAYVLLPRPWSDTCVMVGLTGTATVIVVTVFIPRTYMMTFGIVREQITSSLPSLGYGHGGHGVTDVNYRSTQALYDSVHVAAPKSSSFKGQSNPNYYSPAGSHVHSVPRSRPLTPVDEYDTPPSVDNRITRF